MNFRWSIHYRERAALLVSVLLLLSGGCRVWQRTKVTSASTLESRHFVQQAAESIEQKNMENAESQLKLAVKSNPENIEARTMLADTLWNQGSYSEATKQMEKVVRHPEVQAEQIVKLAWMHFEQNNYSPAQKYVSRALKENNEIADAWILQGKLYEIQGKSDQTLAAYHQAVFLAPENEKTQTLLAKQYLKLGKAQRALETAQTARCKNQSNRVNEEILLCEGNALLQLQRNSEAIQILNQANTLAPQNIEIISALAQAHYQNQNFGPAFQTAARGLEIEPENQICSEIMTQVQFASNIYRQRETTAASTPTHQTPVILPGNSHSPVLPSPVPAEIGIRYGTKVQEKDSPRINSR